MSFTLATYNILADAYIKPAWYPSTPPTLLAPATRRTNLLTHLAALDADLLCLQEVEEAAFAAIEAHLGRRGYAGLRAGKGQRKPDGCATFYRTALFAPEESVRLEYADAQANRPPSGHIAQLLALSHKGRRLGIANTHLKWDPPGAPRNTQYGCCQIEQLLGNRDKTLSGCTAWIICGDLNARPDSEPIALLRAELKSAHPPATHTSNANATAKTIDYLFYSAALRAKPLPPPIVDDHTPLPGPQQPSDHIALVARFAWC